MCAKEASKLYPVGVSGCYYEIVELAIFMDLFKRRSPKGTDEKELFYVAEYGKIGFNNAREAFENTKDALRWNLKLILRQLILENKKTGIYIYNIAKKEFVSETKMTEDQLTRTCRWLGVETPECDNLTNECPYKPTTAIIEWF